MQARRGATLLAWRVHAVAQTDLQATVAQNIKLTAPADRRHVRFRLSDCMCVERQLPVRDVVDAPAR